MLDELKQSYVECANLVPNWDKINKNELCNLYIKNKDSPIGQSYLSAIIVNYWKKINTMHFRSYPAATYEDCYEWVIESILYALDHHVWLDENDELYNDPNGPDKVINRCIISRRLTFFQLLGADKRRVTTSTMSLEALQENDEDYCEPSETMTTIEDMFLLEKIKEIFEKKDYFTAFMYDNIINSNCFDEETHLLDSKKLSRIMHHMNDEYCQIFSDEYELPLEDVRNSLKYIDYLTPTEIREKIEHKLKVLKYTFKEDMDLC